ncbi:natriuretic peptide type C [Cricetulus griseus]
MHLSQLIACALLLTLLSLRSSEAKPGTPPKDKRHRKGKLPPPLKEQEQGLRGRWMPDSALPQPWGRAHGWGGSRHSGASKSHLRYIRALFHLPTLFLRQVPRTPPGEELAEPQAAGGNQKKGDKTPGGGGANLKGDRSRLLRDLRVDTKSRAAWARLLHEHPNARKYKGGNKKGLSKGCFGLKLDRIGSMSGLGC